MEWVRRYRVVLSFYFHSFYYLIQSVILLLSKIYNLMNYLDVLCKYKVPFKKIWVHKTSLIMPLLLECLYQARKVRGHVYVLGISIRFLNCSNSVVFLNCSNSEVFLNCSNSVVFLNCSNSVVFLNCSKCGIFELF